jgi:hypothetical protein
MHPVVDTMATSRFICRCTVNGCFSTPNKFRCLPKSTIQKHRSEEAAYQASLSSRHKEEELTLETLENEHESFIGDGLCASGLLFLGGQQMDWGLDSLEGILDPIDPNNAQTIQYERWYRRSKEKLRVIGSSDTSLQEQARRLEIVLDKYHEDTVTRLRQLWKESHQSSLPWAERILEASATSFIEAEIAHNVRNFQFMGNIVLIDRRSISMDLINELEPKHPHNVSIISHLQWINKTLRRLRHEQQSLPPLRLGELIMGLEEHRDNIFALVKADAMRADGHGSTIITVTRSKFIGLDSNVY